MMKLNFNTLPPKAKEAACLIGKMREEHYAKWLLSYQKFDYYKYIEYFIGSVRTESNDNAKIEVKNWVEIFNAFNLMSPDIEQEMFCYIFSNELNE